MFNRDSYLKTLTSELFLDLIYFPFVDYIMWMKNFSKYAVNIIRYFFDNFFRLFFFFGYFTLSFQNYDWLHICLKTKIDHQAFTKHLLSDIWQTYESNIFLFTLHSFLTHFISFIIWISRVLNHEKMYKISNSRDLKFSYFFEVLTFIHFQLQGNIIFLPCNVNVRIVSVL